MIRSACHPTRAVKSRSASSGHFFQAKRDKKETAFFDAAPTPAAIARKTGDQKVVLDVDPGCADPHAIAEAIPGAWAMVDDAVNWMLSMNPKDRSIVDALLKQTFLSSEDEVRDTVFDKMISMRKQLRYA